METRDFVYIEDVVNATIMGLENANADYNIFNVGSGNSTDVNTVVSVLSDVYKQKVKKKISGDFRVGDIRHNYADISKIKNLIGFVPSVSFKKGIGNFAEWVLAQSNIQNKYEESLEEMRKKGLMK